MLFARLFEKLDRTKPIKKSNARFVHKFNLHTFYYHFVIIFGMMIAMD